VFNRIWDTRRHGYAEKLKHTVEPWVNLQAGDGDPTSTTGSVRLDSTDYIVGGNHADHVRAEQHGCTRSAKGGTDGGPVAPKMLNVGIRQTYYTNSLASAVDPNYSTSFGTVAPQSLSPVSLAARFSPTDELNATFRTNYNTLL